MMKRLLYRTEQNSLGYYYLKYLTPETKPAFSEDIAGNFRMRSSRVTRFSGSFDWIAISINMEPDGSLWGWCKPTQSSTLESWRASQFRTTPTKSAVPSPTGSLQLHLAGFLASCRPCPVGGQGLTGSPASQTATIALTKSSLHSNNNLPSKLTC